MKVHSRLVLAAAFASFLAVGCTSQSVIGPEIDAASAADEGMKLSAADGVEKVLVCHIPPGNPENEHTIVVGAPAVPAHLAHGDSLGECSPCLTGNGAGFRTSSCGVAR